MGTRRLIRWRTAESLDRFLHHCSCGPCQGSRNLTNVMKLSPQRAAVTREAGDYIRSITFGVSLALLALVPMVFSTSVRRTFTLPKFAVLLIGSAALAGLLGLLTLARFGSRSGGRWRAIRSLHVALVCLYVGTMALSTLFGVAPRVALFGSYENLMGLITRV